MNINAFLWVYANINKYECKGDEALKASQALRSLNITNENLQNDEFIKYAEEQYLNFYNLFCNDIFKYKCGLADKPITAKELDCYFVNSKEGVIPIGTYRGSGQDTLKSVAEIYFNGCKVNKVNETSQELAGKYVEKIKFKIENVKKSGKPGAWRVVAGALLSFILLALSLVLLFNLEVSDVLIGSGLAQEALEETPVLYNMGDIGWVIGFAAGGVGLVVAIFGVVKTIIEMVLLLNRFSAENAVDVALDQVGLGDVDEIKRKLISALCNGKVASLEVTGVFKGNMQKKLEKADFFATKSDSQRTGIGILYMILLLILTIIVVLPYPEALAKVTEDAFYGYEESLSEKLEESSEEKESEKKGNKKNDKNDKNDKKDKKDKTDEVTDEVTDETEGTEAEETEKAKVSSYLMVKSDATWSDACDDAENMGGYLISINSSLEFQNACSMAEDADLKVFWVGLKRRGNVAWEKCKWEDGSILNYVKWFDNEPTYYSEEGEEERYLMVFKVGDYWYYNDAPNDVSSYYKGKMGYIIEIEE